MRCFFTMLLLLLLGLRSHLALSLHIGRVIPETANNVSRNSESQRTFIGQEVRRDPHMFPNHAAWHLRHANEVPYNPPAAASPNTTVFESSMTYTTQLTASASTAATGSDASQLASLLHSTEDLVTDSSLDWDQQTESACNIALTSLGGKATSPSGIATCYNIGNLDRSTGIFHVDLRLYRIAACNGDWIQLQTSTPDISLSYAGASLLANTIQKARWDGDRLDWSIAEREEAKDMYLRRSNSASPKKLEDLSFVGTVHNDKLAELSNIITARALLTPNITLSSTRRDGSAITTQLSNQAATFVNGILARQSTVDDGAIASAFAAMNNRDFVLPGTSLVGFPLGLVISSVWASLFIMTIGYGVNSRIAARESYRRRAKSRISGGPASSVRNV